MTVEEDTGSAGVFIGHFVSVQGGSRKLVGGRDRKIEVSASVNFTGSPRELDSGIFRDIVIFHIQFTI